ncbi:MAG: GNAT family N-acetyltransferase [Alphaproteobacteria bacterium]|nr:GNAT family N-acetyltransferase [Alphaproteobacteria bacterium]
MPSGAYVKYSRVLAFRPVDPARDAGRLIEFGRELYRESLGDERAFHREFGLRGERFPKWIADCASLDPAFAAFLTEDAAPIGFVALGSDPREVCAGHVHHFCVAPGYRGQGFGGLLDDYARATLKAAGFSKARLNVTASNRRALRFYAAQGWRDVTARLHARLRYMEVAL